MSMQGTAYGNLQLSKLITEPSWIPWLQPQLQAEYVIKLQMTLAMEKETIFPPWEFIFYAINKTPIDMIKVVILGQDPYHDDGQAHGLAFSVPNGVKITRSLNTILKELILEGFTVPKNFGCLEKWAERGVLLLNSILTVQAHQPNSHAGYGWQMFTDYIIQVINAHCYGVVFLLWGKVAQQKAALINLNNHEVIMTPHPAYRGGSKFLGCNCFRLANLALVKRGKFPVDWNL